MWFLLFDTEFVKAWGPVFVGLLLAFTSILAVIAGFCNSYMLLRTQRRQIELQDKAQTRQYLLSKSKEERDDIIRQLNSFYGPFKELRTQSRLLYTKLSIGRWQETEGTTMKRGSRTLKNLLDGFQYNSQQLELLAQILSIGKELLKLIESQMGVVDRPALQDLLGKLGAHIRILQMAYEKKLTGPSDAFEDIVFPLEIDGAIESAILRLQDRLNSLMTPHEFSGNSADGPATDSTVQYYNAHSEDYAMRTFSLDLSPLYRDFLSFVPIGGRILDAGCGVGRDTRRFIEAGYIVIAIDPSSEMVRKCNEYPHAYCKKLSFQELEFREEFDGVWACASLLHLSRGDAANAIVRLTTTLKPGGIIFASLKRGSGDKSIEGRHFEYYDDMDVPSLYVSEKRLELVRTWHSPSVEIGDDAGTEWINLLLQRKSISFNAR
jgi:SAM-dependent methyltransferase